jgi:DNA-binding response OmpR family regulator
MAATESTLDRRPPTRRVRLRRILIVEPDEGWGSAMRLALEERGYYLNLVRDPAEGRRRTRERRYDLVIASAGWGEAALRAILEEAARAPSPPPALVLAEEGQLRDRGALEAVPCLSILRRPCALRDVVEAARALAGDPWEEDRRRA